MSKGRVSRARDRRFSAFRLLIAVALLLTTLSTVVSAAPNANHPSFVSRHSPLATQPDIQEQSAAPDFPDKVQFRLRAGGFTARRATLNYSLVGDPVTAGLEAEMNGPTSNLDIKVTLDLATHYIPPGSEVAYYWTLLGESGETFDTQAKTFTLLDERYTWRSLTDAKKRVTVHWYSGSQAFGQNLLDTATDALDRLENNIDAGLQRPAGIWVYATQDELIEALPKHIPEWVGGKAFPQLALVMAAIGDDENADLETPRILPHELSHLVLYQATRNPYNSPPAWLDEGLAVYNQETHYPEEEQVVRQAAEEGRLLPIKALSGSFGADEEAAFLAYAQSRSVLEFIITDSRFGPDKLARTVDAFKQGVTYDEALEAGLGVTVDELDKQWREWLPYPVAPPALPGAAPRRDISSSDGQGVLLPISLNSLLYCSLGIFTGLFLAGGLLAVIMLLQRGTRKT